MKLFKNFFKKYQNIVKLNFNQKKIKIQYN